MDNPTALGSVPGRVKSLEDNGYLIAKFLFSLLADSQREEIMSNYCACGSSDTNCQHKELNHPKANIWWNERYAARRHEKTLQKDGTEVHAVVHKASVPLTIVGLSL